MNQTIVPFTIELNEVIMTVTLFDLKGYKAFRVVFSSSRKPLVVVQSLDAKGTPFWTSMPRGRQKEAEGMGKLIETYLENAAKKED